MALRTLYAQLPIPVRRHLTASDQCILLQPAFVYANCLAGYSTALQRLSIPDGIFGVNKNLILLSFNSFPIESPTP